MKELIFILTNSQGSHTLENSPDGWDEGLVQWERSDKYWGVFRSFTFSLKFVKDGAYYLRQEFYTYGVNSFSSIEIKRLNKVTLSYYTAYVGEVDFGTFKDNDKSVDVNLLDSGLSKLIKDNASTEYDVSPEEWNYVPPDPGYVPFYVVGGSDEYGGVNISSLIYRLLDEITDGGMTAGTYGFQSTLLADVEVGTATYPVIICKGQTFRQAGQTPGGMFKTSLEDTFKSLVPWLGCKAGVEWVDGIETFVIEPTSHFFLANKPVIELGDVKNINITLNGKMTFGSLKVGFPEKEYDNYSLEIEPVSNSNWKPMANVSSVELDLISKFRADGTGIKDLIINQTDAADDDIFFVQLRWEENLSRWEIYENDDAQFTGVAGTWKVINGRMTPRRCLLANQDWINSCLWDGDGTNLVYTSGKNRLYDIEVQTPPPFTYVKERDDIALSTPTIVLPLTIDFETPLPGDMIDLLNNNYNELISFVYKGVTFTGYVMQVKAKLAGRTSQKITLLLSASNIANLSTLER